MNNENEYTAHMTEAAEERKAKRKAMERMRTTVWYEEPLPGKTINVVKPIVGILLENEILKEKLEIANSIIKVAVSEYGVYELYAGINKYTYDLGQVPISKEQYDYIKELKENA